MNNVDFSVVPSVYTNLLDEYCVRTGFTKSKLIETVMFFGFNSGNFRGFLDSVESITNSDDKEFIDE